MESNICQNVFDGFNFEHKPPVASTWMYRFLTKEYTVWLVSRRRALPKGYSFDEMARDYGEMIRREFGSSVDIIGISTGGGIALHFAAAYPELVGRLVIHSSAHTLGDQAKVVQMEIARLAAKRHWRKGCNPLPERNIKPSAPKRKRQEVQNLLPFSFWCCLILLLVLHLREVWVRASASDPTHLRVGAGTTAV